MALSKLDNLYRQVILDHSQHPHHHGELTDATNETELRNPTCGDVIKLELDMDGDTIKNIAFSGDGCTISQASSSMMTDAVIGRSKDDAEKMIETFSDMVIGEAKDDSIDILGDAAILEGVAQFPARIKCAVLPWKALHKALNNDTHSAEYQDDNH